uniref:Rho GTPase activating protein 9 n=1 Tax=Sinocyclocheilus rhinocerous TaxID=307959 RepID=A0A673GZS6_9TELE
PVQSMQHMASSEALSSASGALGDAHHRNPALAGGVAHVSHSYSMFLPSQAQRASANGKVRGTAYQHFYTHTHTSIPIHLNATYFMKNWNLSWVVLVGNSLVFFKDPKSQNPDSWKPGNSRPESSVDLRGAQLQWANDLSSRKNVFKVRTRQKSDFILQENVSNSAQVCETLKYAIKYQELSILFPERSILPRSTSNLESSEHKRVKSRLKKLILRRPPLQTLQEKGLIKDQVFGCGLELLCEREKSSVPQFVRKCTDAVERRGLETDGIYRVSGNLAVIQKLRFAVNHERLDLDDPQWEDIHVITGALKLFFRELPEPLVPYGFFHDVVETVKLSDYLDKVDRLKLLVLSMPPHNQHTLQHMIQHLRRVMERSDSNRMTTQNIGIVFGPTLMRPENESGNMAINMVYQNQAVELLLSEYQRIFRTEQTGSY